MDAAEKIRENRLRRMAERQNLRLQKSRRRDEHAWDYGTYQLVDSSGRLTVAADSAIGHGFGLSLDDIEKHLNGGGRA